MFVPITVDIAENESDTHSDKGKETNSDEEFFDVENLPEYYKKYKKIDLEGSRYFDCYWCGFDTDHVEFEESKKEMRMHVKENHQDYLKTYKKENPWDQHEKDFNIFFECETIERTGHECDSL